MIKLYKMCISPYLGHNCKFYPSCSEYAIEALTKKSFFKAIALIIWRLLRCNPLGYGGFDPIDNSSQKGKG